MNKSISTGEEYCRGTYNSLILASYWRPSNCVPSGAKPAITAKSKTSVKRDHTFKYSGKIEKDNKGIVQKQHTNNQINNASTISLYFSTSVVWERYYSLSQPCIKRTRHPPLEMSQKSQTCNPHRKRSASIKLLFLFDVWRRSEDIQKGKKDTCHTKKQIFQCQIPTLPTPPRFS